MHQHSPQHGPAQSDNKSNQNGNGAPPTGALPGGASRPRFEKYRQRVRQKDLPKGGSFHSSGHARAPKDRVRSAWQLVWEFFRLLGPFRRQVILILAALTVATLIGLLPPAGTKFV